jgi:hypothetical protein
MKATLLALAVTMIVGATAAPRAQEPAPAPDKSLERMKAVLAKPPLLLTLPDVEPTFKVEIKAIHPMHEIFDVVPWATDPVGWQPPGMGFDMLSVFRYVAKTAADAKYQHDVHKAHEEVQRAIDDYCAAQPNANRILLCYSSPSVR